MTNRPESRNTIEGVATDDLGYIRDDVRRGDLDRGYFAATPGDFGDRAPGDRSSADSDFPMFLEDAPTRHPGQIDDESYHESHGDRDEYGFVRRPNYRSDVERS